MTLLHALGVSFRHASHPEPLFEPLTFTLSAGEHVALIGPNGSGKSTLMALLDGSLSPTSGTIRRFGRIIGMPQQFQAEAADTVLDAVLSGDPALDAIRRSLRALAGDVADPAVAEQYATQLDRYADLDGYGREASAHAVLTGLGIPAHQAETGVWTLSSGQRSRVGLARLLLTPADLYLLDEPSNHLDLDGQRWLAGYLERLDAAFVLVTHDRLLLDGRIERVMALRRGSLVSHTGSYAGFQAAVANADAQAMQHYAAEQRRAKAAERAAAERTALAKRVATTPPGQGIRSGKPFYEAKAGRVKRTARILSERAEVARDAQKPFVESAMAALRFQHTASASGLAISARDLDCGYGQAPVLAGVSLTLHHGERLAVIGPNGAGKTTLLKTLTGQLPPLQGEVVTGHGTRIAWQDQERRKEQDDLSPLALGLQSCPDESWVRTILACLKLGPEHNRRPLHTLSPGERRKAELARLLLSGANLLILDEPTNHLDLMTREALESVLASFPGAILFVSHDAAFIEAVADDVLELA